MFLDDVGYSKGSLTARTHCRKQPGQREKNYLTVPIKKCPLGTLIRELKIDHAQDWPTYQLHRVEFLYRKAPFFERYFSEFEKWMKAAKDHARLADWNRFLIEAVTDLLDLNGNFITAADLSIAGSSTDYLIGLIRELGGNAYLSGQGAKKYQDPAQFRKAGIDLYYHDLYRFLEARPYPQSQGPWLNGLTVLDALMNIGAQGVLDLFSYYHRAEEADVS